jgi:transcriptional regulator with XRE-family HTH domain
VDTAVAAFAPLLRRWRRQRGLTQLALALDAGVSTRHLSWLETGRAEPSRAMVLRLADTLDVPLRERNAWLRGAGFAPLFAEHAWAEPARRPTLAVVQQLLDAHLPNPALAVDRHWTLLAANRALTRLLHGLVDPALLAPPVNVLRVALHPRGLAPAILNLADWLAHLLARLRRQVRTSGDAVLQTLHDELAAIGTPPGADAPTAVDGAIDAVALPLRLHTPAGPLTLLSTITVFGAPHDVALAELAIETFLAADEDSASRLRALLADGDAA